MSSCFPKGSTQIPLSNQKLSAHLQEKDIAEPDIIIIKLPRTTKVQSPYTGQRGLNRLYGLNHALHF